MTEWRENKSNDQDKINKILDKIAKSGYESLNKEEKETYLKPLKNKDMLNGILYILNMLLLFALFVLCLIIY